jgi:hypothetical protein
MVLMSVRDASVTMTAATPGISWPIMRENTSCVYACTKEGYPLTELRFDHGCQGLATSVELNARLSSHVGKCQVNCASVMRSLSLSALGTAVLPLPASA